MSAGVHATMDQHELEPRTQRRRRRRGLLVFLLVGSSVATFGAGLMSLALFTDSDATAGGFTTGTIDIASTPATLFNVTAMMPGDSNSATLNVANNGTAQLRYALTSSSTNADGKNLASQLQLTVRAGACPSVGAIVYTGVLNSAAWGNTAPGGPGRGSRPRRLDQREPLLHRQPAERDPQSATRAPRRPRPSPSPPSRRPTTGPRPPHRLRPADRRVAAAALPGDRRCTDRHRSPPLAGPSTGC